MSGEKRPADILPMRKAVDCPQCGKESARATWPFCSKRCADLDLGAWLSGGYAIAASPDGERPPDDNESA